MVAILSHSNDVKDNRRCNARCAKALRAECKGTYRIYEIYTRQSREDSGFIIRTVNYFQAESERLINNSFRGERGKGIGSARYSYPESI